ncbi:MAG: aldehyde dehydrogenase EutE, partial [Synergistaceae bacterium]|nr:aldehyde dehydrogenase EutE [Synergistaceae bacterium]
MANQEFLVKDITRKVLEKIGTISKPEAGSAYESVDDAVRASAAAQQSWQWDFLLEERIRIINNMRRELL